MAWIRGKGTIEFDDGIRIVSRLDICRYYQWLIHKDRWDTIQTQRPKHNAHITLVNPKIHGKIDYEKVKAFKGQRVEYFYDPENMYISRVNYWMPVKADVEKQIKWLLRIDDGPKYWGLHLTVANLKHIKR